MITSIRACGHMILITSDERGDELINRREAILRLKGINGMCSNSRMVDMLETLVKAINESRVNETGRGYSKFTLDRIMDEIKKGQLEARQRERNQGMSTGAPSAKETTVAGSGTHSTPELILPARFTRPGSDLIV